MLQDLDDIEFCDHEWSEPKSVGNATWYVQCQKCGMEQQEVLIEEFWEDKFITIKGKRYRALKAWGNITRCAECGKVSFDVPLILWSKEDPSKAITFCWKCVEKLELMNSILPNFTKG